MTKKTLDYDKAYAELEKIVVDLQSEALSLEDMNHKIRRAFELLKFCKSRLRDIETDFNKFFEEEE